MASITVKKAELRHFGEAYELITEYYEAVGVIVRENREESARSYFGAGSGIWLAQADEKYVGCVALRPLTSLVGSGEVKRLYVQPDWRGRGIAELLLNALTSYAQGHGYHWLYLDSKDDLREALRFYRKQGYQDCVRYNENPQATVFMRKHI